jgi:NAD(P)H-hydrate epimerase
MTGAAPVLTADAMRAAESAWFAAGHDSFALMQVAATAVADRAAFLAGPGARILVLAGPGNNGGDGWLAAAKLQARGFEVVVRPLGAPRAGSDAARAAAGWAGPVDSAAAPEAFGLVIDALFGIGLSRGLDGEAAVLAEAVNASGVPVLAVDIPSGVDADSGAVPGAALRATATVTFHALKPGHLLLPGRDWAGAVSVADIGLPPAQSNLCANGPGLWRLPVPAADTHKYARGGALVWSGPALMTGASRLAALAALRAGAGAVTLAGAREALMVHAAQVTAVMLAEADAAGFGLLLAGGKARAACVGPGAGAAARAVATAALAAGKALLLDADALTAFSGKASHLARLIGRQARPVVLTPHEGEFARLFPGVEGSKLVRAQAAAAASGAVVVLKGADGVIAAPDGRAAINGNAPAWLASAGSGDVLAGLITGLLAQGVDGFEAAAAGAWIHGDAGRRLGPGLTADDLAGPILREVLAGLLS